MGAHDFAIRVSGNYDNSPDGMRKAFKDWKEMALMEGDYANDDLSSKPGVRLAPSASYQEDLDRDGAFNVVLDRDIDSAEKWGDAYAVFYRDTPKDEKGNWLFFGWAPE